jgi:NAD(P)-dependent dehydrogenase (short-subunit alcohol dehydrogenase family)
MSPAHWLLCVVSRLEQRMRFDGKTLVVIGGSSGIGLRAARQAALEGADVIIGGRDRQRLDAALAQIGHGARGGCVDAGSPAALDAFFANVPRIDLLFTPGSSYRIGDFASTDQTLVDSPFAGKFWPQYWAVQRALPRLTQDAAIVLVSGAASARPLRGAPAYAACNAAIEGLARALATELAPRRVNAIAPGTLDGDLWQRRDAAVREAAFAHYADATLLGRVGHVEDAADAALFLLGNRYTTGTTLFVDGGYALR